MRSLLTLTKQGGGALVADAAERPADLQTTPIRSRRLEHETAPATPVTDAGPVGSTLAAASRCAFGQQRHITPLGDFPILLEGTSAQAHPSRRMKRNSTIQLSVTNTMSPRTGHRQAISNAAPSALFRVAGLESHPGRRLAIGVASPTTEVHPLHFLRAEQLSVRHGMFTQASIARLPRACRTGCSVGRAHRSRAHRRTGKPPSLVIDPRPPPCTRAVQVTTV